MFTSHDSIDLCLPIRRQGNELRSLRYPQWRWWRPEALHCGRGVSPSLTSVNGSMEKRRRDAKRCEEDRTDTCCDSLWKRHRQLGSMGSTSWTKLDKGVCKTTVQSWSESDSHGDFPQFCWVSALFLLASKIENKNVNIITKPCSLISHSETVWD